VDEVFPVYNHRDSTHCSLHDCQRPC
jgi:hypothetical protein